MSSPIRVEIAPVARIVLDRPETRNSMNEEMGDAIAAAVERLNDDSEVRVVLVEGAGKAFSAGGDFDVLERNAARSPEENRVGMLGFYRRFLSILRLRVPSIAVLHGATVGAGLCFAMACDLRLAANEAKLGANFVRVGLHPGMACSVLLPRLVGPALAAELMLSGRLFDGAAAAKMGLVGGSFPRSELPGHARQLAEELAEGAPIAVQQTKATLLAPLLEDIEGAIAREAACQAITFATSDLREAVRAFRAGEKPRFEGN